LWDNKLHWWKAAFVLKDYKNSLLKKKEKKNKTLTQMYTYADPSTILGTMCSEFLLVTCCHSFVWHVKEQHVLWSIMHGHDNPWNMGWGEVLIA